jgi:hypothetical protein
MSSSQHSVRTVAVGQLYPLTYSDSSLFLLDPGENRLQRDRRSRNAAGQVFNRVCCWSNTCRSRQPDSQQHGN